MDSLSSQEAVFCMLFNSFKFNTCLNVLRVLRDYILSVFSDFKMRVYGMKDESLWDAVSLKMRVYGMSVKRISL